MDNDTQDHNQSQTLPPISDINDPPSDSETFFSALSKAIEGENLELSITVPTNQEVIDELTTNEMEKDRHRKKNYNFSLYRPDFGDVEAPTYNLKRQIFGHKEWDMAIAQAMWDMIVRQKNPGLRLKAIDMIFKVKGYYAPTVHQTIRYSREDKRHLYDKAFDRLKRERKEIASLTTTTTTTTTGGKHGRGEELTPEILSQEAEE